MTEKFSLTQAKQLMVNTPMVKGVSGSTVALASVARRLAKLTTRPTRICEGCLVVRSGHGPQAEVAQGVGPGPLVGR